MCFPWLFLDSKHSIFLRNILSDFVLVSTMTNRMSISNTIRNLAGMFYNSPWKLVIHAKASWIVRLWFSELVRFFEFPMDLVLFPSSKRHKISQRMKFNFFWAYSCITSSKYQVSIFTKKELSILTSKWQRLSLICTPYTACAKLEMIQHRNLTS